MKTLNIHHVGFEVKSLELTRFIYEKYLGFRTEQYMELEGEKIVFLVNDRLRIELIENGRIDEKGLYEAHICFETDCLQILNEKDVSILEGPIRMGNGWTIVFIEGNNGERIELLKRI
ncbi:glyoxalase/bleomycin resistance/dioxygenase family protein [Pradoshia sp. D12]|uniref:VOC family protein n=1 Tax=Bacillaceae TaxID=186817 RepID=UPI00112D0223|nr:MULTISPECIES: VOC family protein [Bacillaceae]QFK70741.1 glyoxalase/bleomycin resistance/dioxygenase family protein [Pradoshia sp. D12]TPF72535.1 glyoxalase/bleomycin resistance/dioxygenase family protein [Bacillus sp. D12]